MKTTLLSSLAAALVLGATALAPALAQEKPTILATLGFDDLPSVNAPPTLPPAASPAPDKNAIPQVFLERPDFSGTPFSGRWTLRADAGNGVGYKRGFSYLEGMIPVQQKADSLCFVDLRVVDFDNENRWEFNLGAGHRWFSPACGAVLGLNSFFDSRRTDFYSYQQIGVGVEALTPKLEFRSNGYLIVGPAHHVVGDSGFFNPGTFNNFFIFNRVLETEVAYSGVDAEVGGRLPFLERFAPRAYIGGYSYFAQNTATAYGVRGRLEAQIGERISLHFSAQSDRVFHTTVSGGLAISFGAPAYRSGQGMTNWEDVLHQRVHRDVNIVINQVSTTTTVGQPVPPPPPPPREVILD